MPNRKKNSNLRVFAKNGAVVDNPYEEKSRSRKKVEGATIFQREYRKRPEFSGVPMSDMGLIRASRDAYSKLQPNERERYDILAKEENERILKESGTTWQRDMYGRSLLDEEKKMRMKESWEKRCEEAMLQLLEGTREEIITKNFYIITANTFLNTYGAKKPEDIHVMLAELTIVRFSIKCGRKGTLTIYPKAEYVPQGHMADVVDSVDDHGIPVDPTTGIEVMSAPEIVRKLGNFVEAYHSTPLFARVHDVDKIRRGLAQIYDQVGGQCPWARDFGLVYPFETFTAMMTNRGIDLGNYDPDKKIPTVRSERLWEDLPAIAVGGQCCTYHSFIDRTLDCSQSQAMACLWWNMNYCARYYNVHLTDNHLPSMVRDRGRKTGSETTDTESSSLGNDDWPLDPQANLSPARPSSNASSRQLSKGRGVSLEEDRPTMSARPARGRGRGLRGRLPKSFD